MKIRINTLSLFKPIFLSILIATILQSCTLRLISSYDETTDLTVAKMQKSVSNYFVKLERTVGTDAAKYENYIQVFDELKVDLNTLEIRLAAQPKSNIVSKQIGELAKMVNNLESLHKAGLDTYDQIKPLRQPFNSAFAAILRLQLALKRGEKIKN